MSRPGVPSTVHPQVLKAEDGGSDRGADVKTNPATPVKQETTSPAHHNGDE